MSDVSSSQQGEDDCGSDDLMPNTGVPFDDMCELLASTRVPIVQMVGTDGDETRHGGGDENVQTITHIQFYRDYVAKSRPCIIRGLTKNWAALTKWKQDAYLFESPESVGSNVTVSLTPNGRADCITDIIFAPETSKTESSDVSGDAESERMFMAPAEVQLPLPKVLPLLKHAKQHAVVATPLSVDLCGTSARRKYRPRAIDPAELTPIPYCQAQNNCLETEFGWLKRDMTNSVREFGEAVFGAPCDATNIWIGTSLSVSSIHQDWYENLYAVVRGVKQFTLVAPWEATLLKKESVRSAKYRVVSHDGKEEGQPYRFSTHIDFEDETMEWIGIDVEDTPEHEIAQRNPEIVRAHPVYVEVAAGDVLYLPAMWFHRVAQVEVPKGDTCVVAVNYWFDMAMDGPLYHMIKYVSATQQKEAAKEGEDSTEPAAC